MINLTLTHPAFLALKVYWVFVTMVAKKKLQIYWLIFVLTLSYSLGSEAKYEIASIIQCQATGFERLSTLDSLDKLHFPSGLGMLCPPPRRSWR